MKSLMQIAMECDMRYNDINNHVRSMKIIPTKTKRTNSFALYLDQYQEHLLHEHLYFLGKLTEINLESKMNSN